MTVPHRLQYAKTGSAATDKALAFAQDATRAAVRGITSGTILDGVLLEGVDLDTGGTAVPHKLGRQPRGWWPVDLDTAATIRRSAWDSRTLTLVPSANCTVSIWVF